MTDDDPPRRLPFEGAANFRDLGGYPLAGGGRTRWRVVYRADSLADLTAADLEALRATGIRTLCDFRLPEERADRPNRLPGGMRLQSHEIGFIPRGTPEMLRAIRAGELGPAEIMRAVEAQYRLFGRDHAPAYRAMFDALLAPGATPFLIHCTSGKDRTGVGAALILLALGAARETVLEDYALTNAYRRDIGHLLSDRIRPGVIETLTSARPEYLRAALEAIEEEWGGLDPFMERGLGLTAARRADLAALLTGP